MMLYPSPNFSSKRWVDAKRSKNAWEWQIACGSLVVPDEWSMSVSSRAVHRPFDGDGHQSTAINFHFESHNGNGRVKNGCKWV